MLLIFLFFFFNDTATTEIYTLSLHDALPISSLRRQELPAHVPTVEEFYEACGTARHLSLDVRTDGDRKSTRLNSSHQIISYAVFCLKKKKKNYKVDTNNIQYSYT